MPHLTDLDVLLTVIENPTRRRILEALVREPHYPLQLSKELGMSQQAIMKHLKVLEDCRLVRSFPQESDQGGPTRKRYVPTTKFTIIVDFGPGLFSTAFIQMAMEAMSGHGFEGVALIEPVELSEIGGKARELRRTVAGLDQELETLQARRAELIEMKEGALEEAGMLVENSIADYQVRRVVYSFVQRPDLSAAEIASQLGLRDDIVEEIIGKLENEKG
jgi:ArsR family transcriptional regulator